MGFKRDRTVAVFGIAGSQEQDKQIAVPLGAGQWVLGDSEQGFAVAKVQEAKSIVQYKEFPQHSLENQSQLCPVGKI